MIVTPTFCQDSRCCVTEPGHHGTVHQWRWNIFQSNIFPFKSPLIHSLVTIFYLDSLYLPCWKLISSYKCIFNLFSGSYLSAPWTANQCKRVRIWKNENLYSFLECCWSAGGVEEGSSWWVGNSHSESVPGLESEAELEQAEGVSDSDLHILEEVEGQESYHGAEAEEEAGVGGVDHPEVLPEMASDSLAAISSTQSSFRVSHLQRLAADTLHSQGD